MNQHLKHVQQKKQNDKISSNADYHIVEMNSRFPFGELRTIHSEEAPILVRKKLICHSKCQQEVLKRTASLLKGLKNDFLINFHHMEREEDAIYFYYDYAHLNMEKWVLDLGEDMWDILKNQMLELAAFLNKNQIFWTFDQKCIGLSKEISIKYFLNEFSFIETRQSAMKAKNLAYNRDKIVKYFAKFKEIHEEQDNSHIFTSMIVQTKKKNVDKESMLCSITTRESWTLIPPKTSRISGSRESRSKITEKLEKSKIKTNEILQKLKKIKNLQF